jgi:probable rRNA maturation factor
MQALNREFRGKDRPTNVLSFPAGAVPGLPRGKRRALGDLVVCAPVLNEEAVSQGKLLAHHWAHILVHGALHLIGFDHDLPADAERMEALETRILAAGGVGDPY